MFVRLNIVYSGFENPSIFKNIYSTHFTELTNNRE